MNLYLDIETIPSQSPEVHARIAESITPPGNYKKPETIAEWVEKEKPALVKEAISKTALDGSAGHVCCLSVALADASPLYWEARTVEDERHVIGGFVEHVNYVIDGIPYANVTIVGHNVANFDIRFLWQRAIILGIRMPSWFPRDPKPWGNDVFDTMTAFAGSRGTIGLERLSVALGMDGKGDVDGSMIGALWAAGEYEKIASYCRADVERTRAIHRRMQIAFGEAP
jgi:hypothetical protein